MRHLIVIALFLALGCPLRAQTRSLSVDASGNVVAPATTTFGAGKTLTVNGTLNGSFTAPEASLPTGDWRESEWWDDFERSDTGSGIGSASSGQAYTIVGGYGDAMISSGRMVGRVLDSAAFYARGTLNSTCRNIGAKVKWVGDPNIVSLPQGVIIIAPDTTFLDNLIHVVFTNDHATIQYSLSGAGGLATLGTVTYAVPFETEITIQVAIVGDYITVAAGGATGTFFNANVSDCNGPIVYWEGGAVTSAAQRTECSFGEVWANAPDPAMIGRTTQAWSPYLDALALSGPFPKFGAYAAADQTIPTGAQTKVTFNTEEFDTNSNFASSRFTVTVPGKYLLSASGFFQGSATSFILYLYRQGVQYKRLGQFAGNVGSHSGSVIVDAAANDYFEVFAFQDTGSDMTMTGAQTITWFNGARLP